MANPDIIVLSGNNYDVYALRADADVYFGGKLDRGSWTAASGTEKDRALISATRLFDLESWEGIPTDLVTPQPIAWPRTGVTDKNQQPVADTDFPEDLLNGFFELAQAVIDDPAIADTTSTSGNIKTVTADVVSVRFFRPTTGTRFPASVNDYITPFLDLRAGATGGFSFGTDQCSSFDEETAGLVAPLK